MWSKSVSTFTRSVKLFKHIRLLHDATQRSRGSYLHNPGSEPLQYITMGDAIEQTAHKYPERVAIRSIHEDLTLTYEQLLKQGDALGCALMAQGLQKGHRVGIWSHNCAAFIVMIVATLRVGLIAVHINPTYEKPELSFCIKKTGLKSILLGDKLPMRDYYKVLSDLIPELPSAKPGALKSDGFPSLSSVIVNSKEKLTGTFSYDDLISQHDSAPQISKYSGAVSPDDGSIIHFTSGTTGDPKAALDSHFGLVNNTFFTGKRNSLHEGYHKICVQVPLFHALGSVITVLGALRHGAGLVLGTPTYNVKANLEALIAEKCTVITGTPTMYVDLLHELVASGGQMARMRTALAAGAPCSPQLIRRMQVQLKAHSVKALYGMTETTASVFQSLPGDSIDLVADTVGYIQDFAEVKVVNEDNSLVPFGSPGEVLVRGYMNMIGYWGEPEKTRQAVGADGWLRTGDKFILTEDGYGRIVGRLKDIIVRGGENIAPKEVEDHLNTHPDIIESQIIGVPDERLGEELCAVLRVKEGASLSQADLRKFCAGHLAKFKVPRIIKTIDEFPKTNSGKIQKFKIKDMVQSGKL